MTIFIDASVFCAYANVKDVHHAQAQSIMQSIASRKHGKPITTDYIFDETVTVALRKAGKKNAQELGKFILDSEIILIKVDEIIFEKAWKIFQEKEEFSFTDCTTLAILKLFGISSIATFDKALKAEGISIIEK